MDIPENQEVHPDVVRQHLGRIIASRNFARSTRLSRFLKFVVEHALNGTSEQVKEYVVGVEVFDRKQTYDPRVDPIVRVEARRLRSKLKSYYASEGRSDEVLIDFPKGAYIPVFRSQAVQAARPKAPTTESGIVVLPFTNLAPMEGDDYFSDGLTEELIHLLTRVGGLRVVAWHSASQLRGREQDYQGIREQLKVDRILRGSVRRSASRVRITAQLVDLASGAYLWSEVYDRDLADVFAIQEEISRAIVATLKPTLSPAPEVRQPSCIVSYSFYLQGRFYLNKRTAEGIRKSVSCFEEAVNLDPEFALAYAGLADSFSLLTDYGVEHPSDIVPRAEAAALRALELDPNSAEAHSSLAIIRSLHCWKWTEAEDLYRKAIALNPQYSAARHWLGVDLLALHGRFEEAADQLDLAVQFDPLSLIIYEGRAFIRMLQRDHEGALNGYRQILEMDPGYTRTLGSQGRVLIQMGRYDEAIEVLRRARAVAAEVPSILGALGQALALAGRTDEARDCLASLDEMAQRRYVASTCFAIVHIGLGEFDRALDWLERACDERQYPVSAIGVHPVYDVIRDQPRFQLLRRRIGV